MRQTQRNDWKGSHSNREAAGRKACDSCVSGYVSVTVCVCVDLRCSNQAGDVVPGPVGERCPGAKGQP